MIARAALTEERSVSGAPGVHRLLFWCPGCAEPHGARVAPTAAEPRWGWDGSLDLPTLSPSILVRGRRSTSPGGEEVDYVCHSFVRAGRIEFLSDSTHRLAGMTVDLPPWGDTPCEP